MRNAQRTETAKTNMTATTATLIRKHGLAAEWRAFWADAFNAGFTNQAEVDLMLGVPGTTNTGRIRDANCNAVIIEVRRNCDACYHSSMGEPYMSGLAPADFNALQAMINAAHDTTGASNALSSRIRPNTRFGSRPRACAQRVTASA